jgi:hypothetical protein
MSDQATHSGDTGNGFITGADPRTPPMTQADLLAMQQSGGQVPHVVINNGPGGQGQPGPQGQRFFTEEEVGAIRTEEKDKLYGRMTEMERELDQLRQDREAREAQAQQEQERLAAEAQAKAEEALDVRQLLEKKDQEWNTRLADIESQRERDLAIFAQERQFTQLQDYRRDRIEQEQEWILPELRDLIIGSNPAEIDNAIEIMKQRTATIVQNLQAAVTQQRGPIRGVAPTGAPPVGPMEQQMATQTLSADEIRQMDNKTFAIYRDQLLGIASRAGAQGLNQRQAQ